MARFTSELSGPVRAVNRLAAPGTVGTRRRRPLPGITNCRHGGLECGKYWLEIATHPPIRPCVVRIYYPERNTMMWYRLQGYGGAVTMKRQYNFFIDNNVQYLQRDGRFFQQILDTDNQSWALLHVCANNDGKSKILFTTREPWTMMPVQIQQRVTLALHNAGLPMLPLTLSACVPHQQPVVPLMRSQSYGK